jgi:hypothetical protein
MGTSVDQIDSTYGHLLPDALDRTRVALDGFLERSGHEVVTARDGPRAGNPLGS